jgi:hypothetical protein
VNSNTANDNGGDGFDVACPATVMYNAASGNGWASDGSQFLIIGPGCVSKGNTSSP